MNTLTCLRSGIRQATRNPRLVLALWCANALFALLLAAPAYALIDSATGYSLAARELLQAFDINWLVDLRARGGIPDTLLPPLLLGYALLYGLLTAFLNGGVITRLAEGEKPANQAPFLQACGANLGPLFRLLLIALAAYTVLLGGAYVGLGWLIGKLTDDPLTEWPVFNLGLAKTVVLIALFIVLNMIFDYAKIILVTDDSRGALRGLWAALKFLRGRFTGALALYLLTAVLFAIIGVGYLELSRPLPENTLTWIALLLILHQLFILLRCWLRLVFFSSEIAFFRRPAG